MPNHVENELVVKGKLKAIADFKTKMHNTDDEGKERLLNEEPLIPYPKHFKDLDDKARQWYKDNAIGGVFYGRTKDGVTERPPKDGFNSGGYEWCRKNWGTKWGFYDVELTDEETIGDNKTLYFSFHTAWSPPLPLIRKMADVFPELDITLKYWEGGSGYKGSLRIKHGKVISDKETTYSGSRGG